MPRAAIALVGQRAGGREDVVEATSWGDPVLVVPEPDNAVDPNAVAVYTIPARDLTGPIVSSVRDRDGRGSISAADRARMRQAGYLPAGVAATLADAIPADGIVGWAANLRYRPTDAYAVDESGAVDYDPQVAGFDVVADWPIRPVPDPTPT